MVDRAPSSAHLPPPPPPPSPPLQDIAIVIINQHIVEKDLKLKVQKYDKVIPTVLQIPSKDHPYDPSKDHVMQRVTGLMGPRAQQ